MSTGKLVFIEKEDSGQFPIPHGPYKVIRFRVSGTS